MTIEEKAKAYDEALNWMRKLYPGLHGATREDAEHYFPELRESEDERIRKDIIALIKFGLNDGSAVSPGSYTTKEEALAYLEKQKDHFRDDTKKVEQEPAQTVDEKEYIRTIKGIIVDFIREKKPEDVAYYQQIFDWLDGRHVEQKPCEPKNWPADKDTLTQEQKPTEKEITLNGFEKVLDSFLFDFVHSPIIDCEPKEYIKNHSAYLLKAAYKELNAQLKQDFFEAQQEGRREGYEAAMVEQKPAEWSEDWQEEDIQTRFAFYTDKDDSSVLYLSNVFVEEASRNHGFGTKILIAAEKVAEAIGATTISLKVKQDSPANAWYRKNGYGYVAFEDGYDWLEKNLEYMKPNKQEWSEEDKETLEKLHRLLIICRGEKKFIQEADYNKMDNLLKSLRPQPHWKPSEDEERLIKTSISFLKDFADKGYENAVECIDWLKSKLNGNSC